MAHKPNPPVINMGQKKRFAKIPMLVMITSCQALTAYPDLPALIVQPDQDSRAALQATLSGLFGGSEVRLADDALTRTSLLTLEPGFQKNLSDPPATGRVLSAPYRFQLIKNGDNCVLIDLRDATRHLLADTTCIPE